MAASSGGAWSSEDTDMDEALWSERVIDDPKRLSFKGIGGTLRGTFKFLGGESVLEELRIGMFAGLDDKSATILADSSLTKNGNLKTLRLWAIGGIPPSVAAILGKMLGENCTLEELEIWAFDMGAEGLKYLLNPLMKNEAGQQPNNSRKRLSVRGYYLESRGAAVVAETLNQNHTLISFSLQTVNLRPVDWCKIVKSLEGNTSLKELDLRDCKGLGSNEVQAVFMDLVSNFNQTLRVIGLVGKDVIDHTLSSLSWKEIIGIRGLDEGAEDHSSHVCKGLPLWQCVGRCLFWS